MKSGPPRIILRTMRRKDAASVARMMRELQAFHGDASIVTARHFIDYCLGARKQSTAWVACIGDKPAAFAITNDWMNFVRAKLCRTMTLLYVAEEFRGQSVGAALLAFIARNSLKKGIARLDTSAATVNVGANAFYKRIGFVQIKHKSHRYGIEGDALQQLAKKTK